MAWLSSFFWVGIICLLRPCLRGNASIVRLFLWWTYDPLMGWFSYLSWWKLSTSSKIVPDLMGSCLQKPCLSGNASILRLGIIRGPIAVFVTSSYILLCFCVFFEFTVYAHGIQDACGPVSLTQETNAPVSHFRIRVLSGTWGGRPGGVRRGGLVSVRGWVVVRLPLRGGRALWRGLGRCPGRWGSAGRRCDVEWVAFKPVV